MSAGSSSTKRERLNIRATPGEKILFRKISAARGETISDFMLDSARQRAQEYLAEEREFTLSPARWNKFTAALEAAPAAKPGLKKLLSKKSALE